MIKKKFIGIVLFCLVILINLSCIEKSNTAKLEQKIIEDIFPKLVENTFSDYRKMYVPPPPPKNDSKEELKKMKLAFAKTAENYKIYIDTTKFAPLYVVINDSIEGYSKQELKRLYNRFKNIRFIDTSAYKKAFKIDLSKIDLRKDYIVKYKSDFTQFIDELVKQDRSKYPKEEKHLWEFSGMLYLYRIYFNKTQDYGFLNVGFRCGKMCGSAYRVFVKKKDDKWEIDKTISLGIT